MRVVHALSASVSMVTSAANVRAVEACVVQVVFTKLVGRTVLVAHAEVLGSQPVAQLFDEETVPLAAHTTWVLP